MLYAIMGTDKEGSLQARLDSRPEHLARLQALLDEGRLVLAGPHPVIDSEDPGPSGFSGSLIVAEFPDLESARTWAEADPYNLNGIFSDIQVKPFRKVLP